MCHQGEEKHRLGSHLQRRHSMQKKISKKQSTMKCDVKEHLIRHKKILKKIRLSKQKKLNLNYILKKIGKKKLLVTT